MSSKRVENPEPTVYQRDDIVRVLVGPAEGRLGKIIVERNGNYIDYEPYCSADSIGVTVVERMDLHLYLEKMITALNDHESLIHTVVRWFDSPEELELVKKSQYREE